MLTQLPINMPLDDDASPGSILDALILAAFASGEQPYVHAMRLSRVLADAPLRPKTGELQRLSRADGNFSHLVSGDGWTLYAIRWKGNSAYVTVTAATDELAGEIMREAIDGAKDLREDPDDRVSMGFWHSAGHGPVRQNRRITAPKWDDIRGNYSAPVAEALENLMALNDSTLPGRLLLLHGAPGTGKTTMLRALAKAWAKWCEVDCVLDPERLFHESGYLLRVTMGDDDNEKWRLLLLEDCDELISASARESSGQALSRLLNLTDGMLAQGRRVLVGLTTNEPVSRLHPAVVRPGRCLAQIEVGRLSAAEASQWLGRPVDNAMTLAELYALKSGNPLVIHQAPEPATGCYL